MCLAFVEFSQVNAPFICFKFKTLGTLFAMYTELHCVSQKTTPTFLASTQESIVGFS